jgi:archaemetzincin
MIMAEIRIVPVGDGATASVVEYLASTLPEIVGARCTIAPFPLDPADAYDSRRNQYNSTSILSKLIPIRLRPDEKVLGVTDVDLFIPILTFVFGEAQLDGSAAVITTHRLHQSFYGLPQNERLLYERCEKEAVHELGHAFGLVHCRDFGCVMHFSNSIENVDLKAAEFCATCAQVLKQAVRRAG